MLIACIRLLLLLAVLQGVNAFAAEKTYMVFTIDVESTSTGNPDRDIWGRLPGHGKMYGIGRMMDIFDRHGVKGTFFLNVYESEKYGRETIAAVAREIVRRGHDVQLHTHPLPAFGVWGMNEADYRKQLEIITWGKNLLESWTGRPVVAHRAGAFAADRNTIRACREAGIETEYSWVYGANDNSIAPGLTMNGSSTFQVG